MLQTLLLPVVLLTTAVGPALALPGSGGNSATATASDVTTTAQTTESSPSATETIIIAAKGQDEVKADGNSKWLTYWVTGEPDWCNGANSSHTITDPDVREYQQPPNLFYGSEDKDPDFLDGCSYDTNGHSFGCDGWSASCRVVTSNGLNGEKVAICDDLDVAKLITCVKDASATTATQTIEALDATTTGPNPAYTSSCNEVNLGLEAWKDEKMEDFLLDLADKLPSDHEGSFIDFMNQQLAHSGTHLFSCTLDQSDGGTCDYDGTCSDNPQYYFAQGAIKRYTEWVSKLLKAIQKAGDNFSKRQFTFVNDFTDHDFPDPNDTWIATLTAGLLGTVSGVFGAAAAAIPGLVKSGAIVAANSGENAAARSGVTANLFGAGAGASSQGNGIANSMMQDAASVIQGELRDLSNLEDYMSTLLNFTQFAFYSWGHNALFKTAKNTGYNSDEKYITTPGNLVDILRDGGFADHTEPESLSKATIYDNSMLKFMWGSAIGYLWSTSNVVIYRISNVTEWIEEDDDYTPPDGPCPLEPWENDHQVAVCDEDTGSMYILQAFSSSKLKGADSLSRYGLSVLDMARYANLTQSTYGFTKWLTDASAKKIQTNIVDAPVNATPPFVGIPVCDLDALKPLWMAERARDQWYDDNKDMRWKLGFISQNVCSEMNVTIDDEVQHWPHGSVSFPKGGDWLLSGVYSGYAEWPNWPGNEKND